MLTVLVVVTHLGLLASAEDVGRLDGLIGDLKGVLVVCRCRDTSLSNGEVVDVMNLVGLVEARCRWCVYSSGEVGLEAFAVLTLSNVNRRSERRLVNVDLNVGVSELGGRGSRTTRFSSQCDDSLCKGVVSGSTKLDPPPEQGSGPAVTGGGVWPRKAIPPRGEWIRCQSRCPCLTRGFSSGFSILSIVVWTNNGKGD